MTPQLAQWSSFLSIDDGGFLTGDPCGPPCFWNIVPGVTTEADAFQKLESRGVNFDLCRRWQRNDLKEHGIECGAFRIIFDDTRIVTGIGFQPSRVITVEDVISKYGEPDAVSVYVLGVSDELPLELGVSLYYDSIYTALSLPCQEDVAEVNSGTEVENIAYFTWKSYAMSKGFEQPWHGYGVYESTVPKER